MKLFRIALALSLTSPLPASATPASTLQHITSSGTLRVGAPDDYAPFAFHNPGENPSITGADIDMAQRLAHTLHVTIQWVPTTWATLMSDYHSNRFDIAVGGISITPERQKTATFSIPYLQDGKVPITRCNALSQFSTLAAINRPSTRVTVNTGGTNETFARQNLPNATLLFRQNNPLGFDLLTQNKADVMITDLIEARLQSRRHPTLCIVNPIHPLTHTAFGVLIQPDPALQTAINHALKRQITSGDLSRSLTHWLQK